MRTLSKLALAALLVGFVAPALAQGTGNTSITVEQPWSRATPGGAKTGAVYMTLDNKSGTADRLTGASSDVADKLQIHEMKVENGVMQMREIAGGLPIPASGSVVLKPGSYHVMLIGLKKPLTAGEKFPLTLTFEKAGNISVTVPVQAMGATQDKGGMGGMGGMQAQVWRRHGPYGDEVMRARQWIWVALAGLLGFSAAALGIVYVMSFRGAVHGVTATTQIGGPFTLVDDTGATVTEKTLAGKPYAMYFGYTFCPDVCPTTLLDLSRWIKKLGPDADRLNYVFVTVDPERDTVQSMHAYLSSFDKHIRGYTGTPAEIAQIAKEYRVYYKKVPTDDGGYTMDHSAIIYLMGRTKSSPSFPIRRMMPRPWPSSEVSYAPTS